MSKPVKDNIGCISIISTWDTIDYRDPIYDISDVSVRLITTAFDWGQRGITWDIWEIEEEVLDE